MTNTKQHGAALLRISFGTLLLSHGFMKVLIFTIPGTVQFFGSLGLPPIAAYLTMFGEVAGGLAILTGVLTRLASTLTIPLLLGATYAHSTNGWVFSNAGGGWEFPALLVVIAITIALQGAGSFALGRKLPKPFTA